MLAVVQTIALVMSIIFLVYVVVIALPYLRQRPRPHGDAADFRWHLFVPCRDEEAVIGTTMVYLRRHFPHAHVWVIDDASEDATAEQASRHAGDNGRVHLVSRRLPEARRGKGEALNSAYDALDDWLPPGTDRRQVIVGVVDADGRPSRSCLDICASPHLFGDPPVSSVQVTVRMINRNDRRPFPSRGRLANIAGRVLVRMQDIEFRAAIAAIQLTRHHTRTVALGGNGQFTRLSALDSVRDHYGRPWHCALLEDYELSLNLLTTGHRIEYAPEAVIDQEGLPRLSRLLAQRTRWGQGTMQCGRYLSRIWSCGHLPRRGVLEVSYYLVLPWLYLLGTFVYPVPFIASVYYGAQPGGMLASVLLVLLGLAPLAIWGPLYARSEPGIPLWRSVGYGVLYAMYVLLFYVSSWRAFFRIVRGRDTWLKTRRNAEPAEGATALEL